MFTVVQIKLKKIVIDINSIKRLKYVYVYIIDKTMGKNNWVLREEEVTRWIMKQHSVQFNHSVMSNSLWPHRLQHARPPCPSPILGGYPNSCPLRWWCQSTISSSVISFSSHPQSFPASGSFQMSQRFALGGQSIGVSASTSVLPMNIQDQFLLGWTGWISLQSRGLSRVFSKTAVQKHQVFGT